MTLDSESLSRNHRRCFGCDISPRDCDAVDDKVVLNSLLIVEFHLQEAQKSQAIASVMPWHNQDQKEAGCRSGSESRVVSRHSECILEDQDVPYLRRIPP